MTTPGVDAQRMQASTAITGLPLEDAASRESWDKFLQPKLYTGRALHDKAASRVARRYAMPQATRGRLWLRLSGGEALLRKKPYMYESALAGRLRLTLEQGKARAQQVPVRHDPARVPSFGSPTQVRRLCLSPEGQDRMARVLLCLQYEHSEALFCPFLPTVVAACLHWMDERQAFATATALLRQPSPFVETRLQTWLMLVAMDQLAASSNARAYRQLCDYMGAPYPPPLNQQHPLSGAVMLWVSHHLPFWALMRFLDNFVVEGDKTFYRFGLALLQCWKKACPHAHPDTAAPPKRLPVPVHGISPREHLNSPESVSEDSSGRKSGSSGSSVEHAPRRLNHAGVQPSTATTSFASALGGPGALHAGTVVPATGDGPSGPPPLPGRRSAGRTPTPDDERNAPGGPPANSRALEKKGAVTFQLGTVAGDGEEVDYGEEAEEEEGLDSSVGQGAATTALAGQARRHYRSSSGDEVGLNENGGNGDALDGLGNDPWPGRERSDSLVSYFSDVSESSVEDGSADSPADGSLRKFAQAKDDLAMQAMSSASLVALEQMFLQQKKDDHLTFGGSSTIAEEEESATATVPEAATIWSGGGNEMDRSSALDGGRQRSMSGGEVLLARHHQQILKDQRQTEQVERHAKEFEDKPVRSPSMTLFEFNGICTPSHIAKNIACPDKLVELAFDFSFSRDDIKRAYERGHALAKAALSATGYNLAVGEPMPRDRRRGDTYAQLDISIDPVVQGPSPLISTAMWRIIWRDVPIRYHLKDLVRVFDTAQHGYSLNTFYKHCSSIAPTVLVVKTMAGDVFGAFLTYGWDYHLDEHGRGYFGNGESFVFRCNTPAAVADGAPPCEVYPWVGITSNAETGEPVLPPTPIAAQPARGLHDGRDGGPPSLFMHGSIHRICVGGGSQGHAIELDSALRVGRSQSSDTYGSPSLVHASSSGDFEVAAVQVFAFVEHH